jgi:hypothetical protein
MLIAARRLSFVILAYILWLADFLEIIDVDMIM